MRRKSWDANQCHKRNGWYEQRIPSRTLVGRQVASPRTKKWVKSGAKALNPLPKKRSRRTLILQLLWACSEVALVYQSVTNVVDKVKGK